MEAAKYFVGFSSDGVVFSVEVEDGYGDFFTAIAVTAIDIDTLAGELCCVETFRYSD